MPTAVSAPLLGREADVVQLARTLAGGAALVTVTGGPGVGKTRLARAVLEEAATTGTWSGGRYWCDLRPCQTRDALVTALAVALRVPLGGQRSADDLLTRLGIALHGAGRVLLVVDNLERLLDPARAVLAVLFVDAPDLSVLATSREALSQPGEVVHTIGGLGLPLGADAVEVAPAVRLYLTKAASAGVHTLETPESLALIGTLVTRLDGNPLAIELAAMRAPVLGPRQLLARLDRRFDLLRSAGTGPRDGLWSAINDSWEALVPAERRALVQLAVFRGGASVDALEAVMSRDAGYDGAYAIDLLGALVRKSLAVGSEEAVGDRRLDLHESIREFALTAPESTIDVAIGCHFDWATSLAHQLAVRLREPATATDAHAALARELWNLFAACASGMLSDAPTARYLAATEALLALCRALPAHAALTALRDIYAAALSRSDVLPIASHLRLLDYLAGVQGLLRDADGARALVERAKALALTGDDPALEGYALGLSRRLFAHADPTALAVDLERAVALLDAPGWHEEWARACGGLTLVYMRAGRFDDAERLMDRAIPELDDDYELASMLNNYAMLHALRGDWSHVRERLGRALSVAERGRNTLVAAVILLNLGAEALVALRIDAATSHLTESLRCATSLGFELAMAEATGYLGGIDHVRGDLTAAHRRYSEALRLFAGWGQPYSRGLLSSVRALVDAQLGNAAASDAGFAQAVALLAESGDAMLAEASEIHQLAAAVALARMSASAADTAATAIATRAAETARTLPPPVRIHQVQHARTLLRVVSGGDLMDSSAASPAPTLHVTSGAAAVTLPGGVTLDLRRKPMTRRLVELLVERHERTPGVAVTVHELFEAAWPGDRTPEPSRSNRVYVALTRLRSAGFEGLLRHDGDGYHLARETRVSRDSTD